MFWYPNTWYPNTEDPNIGADNTSLKHLKNFLSKVKLVGISVGLLITVGFLSSLGVNSTKILA